MRIAQFIVDAFAAQPFSGNPAAVCPLPHWLPDALMQAIAAEHQLSETAFFVREGADYALRWFTPKAEVALCGHATLAAAHVLFSHLGAEDEQLRFHTRSGVLVVQRLADGLAMDFPASTPQPCDAPAALLQGLGIAPVEVLAAEDYLVVYRNEAELRSLSPDLSPLLQLPLRGVIATAPSEEFDFVSRFFGPKLGIDEDPVTGSAHCQLAPYWARRLGRPRLRAWQASARGGEVGCELLGERVRLQGKAVTFSAGEIQLP